MRGGMSMVLLISNLARIAIGFLLAIALGASLAADPKSSAAAMAASAAVFFGIRKLNGCKASGVDRMALILLIALVITNFVVAFVFKSMQPSDFGIYFRCDWNSHLTIDKNIDQCGSKYMSLGNLYWIRSFFYTIPLNAVFDHSYLALKLTNALLQSIFLGMLWGVARASLGPVASLAALIFVGIYPERIYAIPLATTDHLALVLTIWVFGMTAAFSGRLRGVVFGVLIAAFATVVDAARGTGQFLLLAAAFALTATAPLRPAFRIAAVLGILGLATIFGSAFTIWFGGASGTDQSNAGLMLLSGLDMETSQSFASTFSWMAHYWPAIPAQDRLAVAIHLLAQEIAFNGHFLPNMIYEKTSALFDGSGYAAFATLDFSSNLDTELTAPAGAVAALPGGAATYRALTLPLLTTALAGMVVFRPSRLLFVAMIFFLGVCATLIGFFTVQPRYSLVLLPSLAVFAAQAFVPAPERQPGSRGMVPAAAVFCGLIALAGLAWLAIRSSTSLPLKSIRQVASNDDPSCDTAPVALAGDALRQTITLPLGLACATIDIPLPGKTTNVSLFVGSGFFPYLYEPPRTPAFTFRAGDADNLGPARALGGTSIVWLKTPIAVVGGADTPFLRIRIQRAGGVEGPVNVLLAHLVPE